VAHELNKLMAEAEALNKKSSELQTSFQDALEKWQSNLQCGNAPRIEYLRLAVITKMEIWMDCHQRVGDILRIVKSASGMK